MRYADFEALVRRLAREVPAEFLGGVAGIEVSPKVLPHPVRGEIYTLGECIPLPAEGESDGQIRSRVVLYHGSFQALAALQDDFDWREETWETLAHELRHHLEWRARVPDLEAFDWAAEQNFARGEGEPFDPDFPLSAERVVPGVYRLDDDFFLDCPVRRLPAQLRFEWHGAAYLADLPVAAHLPALIVVEGVAEPPPGELVLLLHRPPGLLDLFRRRRPPFQGEVEARAAVGPGRLSSPGGFQA
jgi:hypothetical protein